MRYAEYWPPDCGDTRDALPKMRVIRGGGRPHEDGLLPLRPLPAFDRIYLPIRAGKPASVRVVRGIVARLGGDNRRDHNHSDKCERNQEIMHWVISSGGLRDLSTTRSSDKGTRILNST